jgi:hypothetical protein
MRGYIVKQGYRDPVSLVTIKERKRYARAAKKKKARNEFWKKFKMSHPPLGS